MNTPTPTPTPVAELRHFLDCFVARCREARWLGALFHVSTAQSIVADIAAEQERIAHEAYTAEQADLEAAKLLEDAARDGLAQSDMPAVAAAIRHIRRSAKHDHHISEVAHA